MKTIPIDFLNSLSLLIGKRAWAVLGGGSTGSAISIYFGEKNKRNKPINNPKLSDVERFYNPSYSLFITCDWNLFNPESKIFHTSLDEVEDQTQYFKHILEKEESVVKVDLINSSIILITFNNNWAISILNNSPVDVDNVCLIDNYEDTVHILNGQFQYEKEN